MVFSACLANEKLEKFSEKTLEKAKQIKKKLEVKGKKDAIREHITKTSLK
jgi:hypothetical protein